MRRFLPAIAVANLLFGAILMSCNVNQAPPQPPVARDEPPSAPRPVKPPEVGGAEGETLAGKLLRKRRRQGDD